MQCWQSKVDMHITQTGNEERTTALNVPGSAWDLDSVGRPNFNDSIASDQDSLVGQHALAVHRNNRDVLERQVLALCDLSEEQHAKKWQASPTN
jgi:hypothetical protein